jgi:aldehyde:ferredoxin oxidoreductase
LPDTRLPGGYNGKILRVNLSNRSISTEAIAPLFCRKYLGGAGFITYFLWKELSAGIDPLGPENKLIFAVGPLTGVNLPGSGRNCVGAKSPLTGSLAKSEVGEVWGSEFRRAGFDAVIVEGKADKPVYLWIHDGEVSIREASRLWGQKTKEAQQAIRAELGDERIRVAGIGPAGENLVRFACIMNGLYDAAGRGGLGAVMGSKNLKAIAVRGHQPPPVAKSEGIKELRDWLMGHIHLVRDFQEFGTGAGMAGFEAAGNLPVRNFRDGLFPAVGKIDARVVRDTIRIKMDACFGCPVRCKKVVEVKEPYSVDPAYGGPEYETLAALGSNCGIDDLRAIAKGNELCGAYSLDTISTGGVIAFAMECFENGLLTLKDTGGLKLRFGNAEAMLKLIELIARRQGIGSLLADGTLKAAQQIGRGAEQLAMQVKGLEAGMHEPRAKPGLGLGFMVNPHGADHCCNLHDTMYVVEGQMRELRPLGILEPVPLDDIGPRKVALFRFIQLKRIMFDSAVLCLFLPYSLEQAARAIAAATGWDTGVMEQLRVAERILTIARLFNIREGFTAADDKLPQRFFQPKTDGVLANKPLDPAKLEKAKSYYYTLMGWDARTGVPLPEKLEELGIA